MRLVFETQEPVWHKPGAAPLLPFAKVRDHPEITQRSPSLGHTATHGHRHPRARAGRCAAGPRPPGGARREGREGQRP